MKLMLALLMASTSVVAAPGDVLLTCTRTVFRDLNTIVITESDLAGKVIVTETADDGSKKSYSRSSAELLEAKKIELSSWNGYSRNLYNVDSGWYMEHFDECSGGNSYVICE